MILPASTLLLAALTVAGSPISRRAPQDLPLDDPTAVVGSAPVSIPFTRIINSTSTTMAQLDKERAQFLSTYSETNGQIAPGKSVFNIPAVAQAVSYVTTAAIGNPPTDYALLIDTGSSNTWVGAANRFEPSSTTMLTDDLVGVTYGSGFFWGAEVIDQVTLGSSLTITNQSIGVAVVSSGFDGVDGILGIGPVDLTCGTLLPDAKSCIPTVLDNAFSQGLIESYEVGISFEPAGSGSAEDTGATGELTFGGIDEDRYKGSLNYVPLTTTSPASDFVGIDQRVYYGDQLLLDLTAGIVDTGTTLVLIASDAFAIYQNATGAIMDQNTGLLSVTPDQYQQLRSMYFEIGGIPYEFTANAQIWPRALNSVLGGQPDTIYLIVSDTGTPSGQGLDFINGMKFLERFYAVYDAGQSRVGFAETMHTYAESN